MAFDMMDATTWMIIVTSLIWIIWDIALYVQRQSDKRVSTISMKITAFSWYSPVLPFAFGLLMGHWFWPA